MTIGPRIYNLFPLLCGPLSTWGKHLARIAYMKFDWIFVNPFHLPGSSGSLYSVKDYYRYNPLIVPEGEDGDRALQSFVAACEQHRISLMIDLVINHTAKDSVLTEQHPEWYRRKADGTLVSAGCEQEDGTFVEWEDLAELNYEDDAARQALIAYARTDGVEVDLPRTVEVTPGGQGQSLADLAEVTLEPGQVRVFVGSAAA